MPLVPPEAVDVEDEADLLLLYWKPGRVLVVGDDRRSVRRKEELRV
jgi:hypothetical protein